MSSSLEAKLGRVERLRNSGAVRDLNALLSLLSDEEWQTRRAAAEAISGIILSHDFKAEKLFDELISAAADSREAGRRAAAIAALEGIGERALPRILKKLQSEPVLSSARIALAGVVGMVGNSKAVRFLSALADDAETNVATASISALGRTRNPAATPTLLRKLKAKDEWLRFAALGALGELGDERAIPEIERLLDEPLTQEAAAAALVEISTLEAARALARHLRRDTDNLLRPLILMSLVSLCSEKRSWLPRAMAKAIQAETRKAFRQAATASTFDEIARLASSSDLDSARAGLTLLGWMRDTRAVPLIARALHVSSFTKVARAALAEVAHLPEALDAMLEEKDIPPAELASALTGVKSAKALIAAARLSVETKDVEALEASINALAQGREWLRSESATQIKRDERRRLTTSLRKYLLLAEGRALAEIAALLGVLFSSSLSSTLESVAADLSRSDTEDHLLARLALFHYANHARALEEAARLERHRSARVRMSAVEVLGMNTAGHISLASHLTDEAAGVRRAATRALKNARPTPEARRALFAALDDDDIWVRAEAINALGAHLPEDEEIRARLREALDESHPVVRVAAAQAIYARPDTAQEDWRALERVAQDDSQAEVRRAAVQVFAHCANARMSLRVARTALKDSSWHVRRAAIEMLGLIREAQEAARKILARVVADVAEDQMVRGAALRALAQLEAPETSRLACRLISEEEMTLVEDAYLALLSVRHTQASMLRRAAKTCVPRAASIINFILSIDT